MSFLCALYAQSDYVEATRNHPSTADIPSGSSLGLPSVKAATCIEENSSASGTQIVPVVEPVIIGDEISTKRTLLSKNTGPVLEISAGHSENDTLLASPVFSRVQVNLKLNMNMPLHNFFDSRTAESL